jgi:hypothetical protein
MSFRPELAGVISLMILGCATPVETTETAQERAQREPPVIRDGLGPRHYDARGVRDTHSHRLGF